MCENVRARERRRIVFSIVFSRLLSSAFFVFQIDDVEMKFLSANSISEFSHGLDPLQTLPSAQGAQMNPGSLRCSMGPTLFNGSFCDVVVGHALLHQSIAERCETGYLNR